MIDYSHDDFFDVSIEVEFELEKECARELLKGRKWVLVEDVNSIATMQGAYEGYTWQQGGKHSEIAFYDGGIMARCKLFYHAE
jgi:hypothetical protein